MPFVMNTNKMQLQVQHLIYAKAWIRKKGQNMSMNFTTRIHSGMLEKVEVEEGAC